MNPYPTPLLLSREEIPDDDAFLDEMLALVEHAGPPGSHAFLARSIYAPPPGAQPKLGTVWRVISSLMFYGALAVALLAALVFNGGQGEVKNLLGYSYFTVMSPSMQSSLPTGSLIITKKTDAGQLAAGDIITFYAFDGETTVTHRILEVLRNGTPEFRTKGDDNPSPDPEPVPAGRVIGKVVFNAKFLGKALLLLQKHIGWALAIFFLLICLSFALQQFLRKEEVPQNKKTLGAPRRNAGKTMKLTRESYAA